MSHDKMLLAGSALLLLLAASTFAGPVAPPKPAAEPKGEAPPLTFVGGLLTLDVQERIRFEGRSNTRDFSDALNDDNDDAWVLNRFRVGLAYQPTNWLKFYAQTQDTREWNSERPNTPGLRGTEGDDHFDVRLAYIEFGDSKRFPLSLTVGRQILNYGDARLVADGNWNNFGRTFDAVKLRYQKKGLGSIDVFASRPVQIKERVVNDSDSADHFYGIYATLDVLPFQTTDLYVLYRDKEDHQPDLDPANRMDPRGTWNGPAQRITTIGTRWASKKGALGNWDYGFEAAYQFGDYWTGARVGSALDHHAFATHLHGGYTWEETAWKPRLALEYNYASGDKNPNDGRNESFQNLFPSNFAPYGYIDEFSWRNLHNLRAQFTVQPARELSAELSYHAFWLADTRDYWYRSNGLSTLRTATPTGADVRTIGASKFAGHELDLAVTYKPTEWLTILAGYSHFFTGNYVSETGPDDDADFGYLQVTLQF